MRCVMRGLSSILLLSTLAFAFAALLPTGSAQAQKPASGGYDLHLFRHAVDSKGLATVNGTGALLVRAERVHRRVDNGDRLTLGETQWEDLHCPGHTPGHVVFFNRAARFAQVGDVLFQGSMGRTDFPRGNHQDLIDSITQRLWPMGGDTAFVPGHGPMSTFAHERATNPFVADRVLAGG